jgi:hypothetical protein
VVFDRDGFILQVHGVFTRIRSGATSLALYSARGWIYKLSMAAVAHQRRFLARSAGNGCSYVGWKTLRVLASIYKPTRPLSGRMDKFAHG